jgi:REP element-mobilizing transposase RayT
MARREVIFLPGQYYHIYNRGANRKDIFLTSDNYEFLLRRVREKSIVNNIAIIAYCLMPNHYHFLVRQNSEISVGDFTQSIFNSYSKAFNKSFCRTGTLFEGPYKAIAIAKYEYLLHLCRYIHINPVEAGLVTHPSEWKYSNYVDWIGKRIDGLTDLEFIQENFPQPEEYEEFVLSYVPPEKDIDFIKRLCLE